MSRRIVITGADGFLGWHLRCRLLALTDATVVGLGHAALSDPVTSSDALADADVVIHVAGVNRGTDEAVAYGNSDAARALITACNAVRATPDVVFANSIHVEQDTTYGRGKRAAAELLADWTRGSDAAFTDVRLPNLFGEHGRPFYNSVVATFCHQLASGATPEATSDATLSLVHAQQAAAVLIQAAYTPSSGSVTVNLLSTQRTVPDVLALLTAQAAEYNSGQIPDLSSVFERDMFNTYRSHTFPQQFPLPIARHSDDRGSLFECVRVSGGEGQTFLSSSHPGVTRGEHFHLQKVERFVVVAGHGEIRLRRLFTDEVVTFEVDGRSPQIVDMPTLWAHSITNTGSDELLTLFWANELFDKERSDTYPEPVLERVSAA